MFYLEPNSLKAVGEKFGLHGEGIRQIITKYYPEHLRKRGDANWMHGGSKGKKKSIERVLEDLYKFGWSKPDVDFIVENYGKPNISARSIANHLGRTKNQVIGKANRLKKIGLIN